MRGFGEPLDDDTALVVEDVQVDFCAGGALAVPEGDHIVPVLNQWIEAFMAAGRPVVYTRDWHPPAHCSFRKQGGQWPPHCVQGSRGADFHPRLRVNGTRFQKAYAPEREAYSDFEGSLRLEMDPPREVSFADWLCERGIRHLYIGGLATDYCVRTTVLDALRKGLRVTVLSDAVRAVNVRAGDGDRALSEMRAAGARII